MARENDLWCVGVMYDSQEDKKAGKVSGYRVLGCAVEGYKDVDKAVMKQQLTKYPGRVRGLQISQETGDVIGTCGDIGKYPKSVKGAFDTGQSMLLLGKLPGSGVRVWINNGCSWLDYDTLRVALKKGFSFVNAVLSGDTDAEFDALTTKDGLGVADYDPDGLNIEGRKICPDLYDESAKMFGIAIDVDETKRKLHKNTKDAEELEKALIKTIEQAQSAGLRIINRKMDDTGGIYLKNAAGVTVEDRLLHASRVLKEYAPFMFSAWSNLRKVDTYDIHTAGVTLREFLYNPDFINSISDSYLHHLLEHEMSHVLMEHVARGFDKQGDIWNMACDLIVNARIADEHGLRFVGDERQIHCKNTKVEGEKIKVLSSTISSVLNRCNSTQLDLNKDTTTSIYFEILEEMKQQQQSQGQQGQCQQGQGQQGKGQQSQSQKGQGEQGKGQKGQGQQGHGQKGDSSVYNEGYEQGAKDAQIAKASGNGFNQQGQEGQSSSTQMKNSPEWMKGYSDGFNDVWNGTLGNSTEHGGMKSGGQSGIDQGSDQYITFRGERIKLDPTDIAATPEEASMSKAAIEQASKSFLIGVVERHRRQFGSFGGPQSSYFERLVEEALVPRVKWESAVKKRFMEVSGRDRSYRTPDRRFIAGGNYYAGESAQIPDMLKNLKIGLDLSGSIGNEDVGICMGQLDQLLKQFKCNTAELLCWDTEVRERVAFKDYKELIKKVTFKGGGGTDCNCVFAEFERAEYKNRKKPAPGYIIIFTDGVFSEIKKKYYKYAKNTIWVLPDFATLRFRPPFGLKTEFEAKDSKPKEVKAS